MHLELTAMCRNDKKLLKYQLKLDLLESVKNTPDSYLEQSSVGRVFLNLAKAESPSRWRKLLADNAVKPPNMGLWWEVYEKYEKELEQFAPEDDDDGEGQAASRGGDEEGDDVEDGEESH